tara:strand:- start:409 stop:663 length:255 start_codon:yes stop_codon:yes gene_type:complete
MEIINYTDARNSLAKLMETAQSDREPVTITRNGVGSVVLIAAEEYSSMVETLHLLSTPTNAERIRRSLADYEAGNTVDGALAGD